MGVVKTGESEFEKEMARWDAPKRHGGHNADGYEEFPLMLSKAQKLPNGQSAVHQMPPVRWRFDAGPIGDSQWDQAVRMAEEFTRSCQRTVKNQYEYDRAIAQGWVRGQDAALVRAEETAQAVGNEAAARAYRDRLMSEKAQREIVAAEAATSDHLAEVPEVKRRGRPKKQLVPA